MKVKLGLLLVVVGACSQAKAEPTHFVCYSDDPNGAQVTHYIVVEPETGEFLFFDGEGAYINTAHWKNNHAMDNPRNHFVANINGISLFFNLQPNDGGMKIWQFVLFKEGYDPAVSYCY